MSLFDRWQRTLNELCSAGRLRGLTLPRGIDFSSNDYLGYAGASYGLETQLPRSGAASRLLRGHHAIWDEVEKILADWHGAEAALMFTSGYHANEGLLSTIIEPTDVIASDERNHASLIDGMRLSKAERFVFRHNDLDHLQQGLRAASARRLVNQQFFVVTEALFSMDGDRAPLPELVEICRRHHAHLIVDEAHSTGCIGLRGSGLVDCAGFRSSVLATVHTGGKALGVTGAYICGSRLLRDLLVNRCRHLIFTTALPPVVGAWWLHTLDRVRGDDAARERLHVKARFFRAELEHHGCKGGGSDYIVPIHVGRDDAAMKVATQLQAQGYDIRAIRPPTVPAGAACLRISIHANHDEDVLRAVAAAVAALRNQ